jgi:serine/threonine protein kinase
MGMSTLQLQGTKLQTSCGSPHYAAPEVIEVGSVFFHFLSRAVNLMK